MATEASLCLRSSMTSSRTSAFTGSGGESLACEREKKACRATSTREEEGEEEKEKERWCAFFPFSSHLFFRPGDLIQNKLYRQAPGPLERPVWSDSEGNPVLLGPTTPLGEEIASPAVRAPSSPSSAAAPEVACSSSPSSPPSSSLPSSSSPPQQQQWRLVVDEASDPDGWRYASVFKHLEYERQGGRASQRLGDLVRRRRWVRASSSSSSSAAAAAVAAAEARAAAAAAAAADAVADASATGEAAPPPPSPSTTAGTASNGSGGSESARIRAADASRRFSALRAFVALLSATVSRRSLWSLLPLDPAAPVVLAPRHAAAMISCAREFRGNRAVLAEDAGAENDSDECGDKNGVSSSSTSIRFPRAADLVLASLHSRAAYGYAAAAGHLASLTSYAKMHTVVRATEFDAASGASDAANNDAVARLVGGGFQSRKDLLFSSWAASVSRPCHYVALDRASRRVVLSVRGSLAASDLLSNLSARPMEVSLLGVQGRAHEGMMRAATFVHCSTAAALEKAAELTAAIDEAEEVEEEEEEVGGEGGEGRPPFKTNKKKKPWPLLCVGHSMGGGVATLVATLLKEQQEAGTGPAANLGPISAIAVGPAAVLSAPLAARVAPFVTSVVLGADAVPRLSYASVEACLLELAAASPVRMAAAELARAARSTAGGIGGLFATAGAELREILGGNAAGGGGAAPPPAISGASPPRSSPLVPSPPREEGLGALTRKVTAAVEGGSPRRIGDRRERQDSARGDGVEIDLDLGGGEQDLDDAAAAAAAAVATIAATSAAGAPAPPPPPPLSAAEAEAVIERRRAMRAASAGGGGGGGAGASSREARAAEAEAEAEAALAATTIVPAAASLDELASHPAPPLSLDGTGDGVEEHPEPLLVAGRLLWILPPGELAAAAGGPSLEDAAVASAAAAAVEAASAARVAAQRAEDSEREERKRREGEEEEGGEAEAAGRNNAADAAASAAPVPSQPPPPPPPPARATRVPGVVRRVTAEGAGAATGNVSRTAGGAETTPPLPTTTTSAPLPPPKPAPLLLAPPAAAFVRLLLTPDALVDHLPDAYVAAVEQL